jgi:predicted transcriptional regulator
MDEQKKVLQVLEDAGIPLSQKEIEAKSGLDTKVVDKAMKALKKEEKIVSKVRCKWEPNR